MNVARKVFAPKDGNVHDCLEQIAPTIEKVLGEKLENIIEIKKVYGSNAGNFILETRLKNTSSKKYFLKFTNRRLSAELEGIRFLQNKLPVPHIIASSNDANLKWILTEYIEGELMAERYLNAKSENAFKFFCKCEIKKEDMLARLYGRPAKNLEYEAYIELYANQLFHQRLFGERYSSFYRNDRRNIARYFNRTFLINGRHFPYTINQVVENIRGKYSLAQSKIVRCYPGHGDAHHGNIILNGNKINFIDNEYAGFIPPFMELAKPYYNDFIGTLFFHHQKELEEYFPLKFSASSNGILAFSGLKFKKISHAIKITNIKLQKRKKWINGNTDDFLSLNDYLVLCHMLTKNPNNYGSRAQLIFLLFIVLLTEFDPLQPESLYSILSA